MRQIRTTILTQSIPYVRMRERRDWQEHRRGRNKALTPRTDRDPVKPNHLTDPAQFMSHSLQAVACAR